jgi:membrane protein
MTPTGHGRHADTPTEIPARGWKDVVGRVKSEAKEDNIPLLSAGVAFFSLLALVPGLVAMISMYGLVADPATVQQQVADSLSAAPKEVRDLVSSQLSSIASSSGGSTLIAVVVGIVLALWTASAGIGHLMQAINVAYDEEETRGFVKRRAIALAFTVSAIVLLLASFVVIAVVPAWLASTGLGLAARVAAGLLRWVLLFAVMIGALAVLYRFAPDRDEPKWRWASAGAAIAALVWLLGSIAFSIYTANFAKYNKTYGSLGAVVVLMLWLYLTSLAVILGAEVNSELERQTFKDSTTGAAKPLGERNAYAADTVGSGSDGIDSSDTYATAPTHQDAPQLVPRSAAGEISREGRLQHLIKLIQLIRGAIRRKSASTD